jgi:hypothetical protein
MQAKTQKMLARFLDAKRATNLTAQLPAIMI